MLELTEKEKRAHEAAKRIGAAYGESEKDIILDVIFAAESKYFRKLGPMTVIDFIEHEMKIDSQLMYDLNIVTRRESAKQVGDVMKVHARSKTPSSLRSKSFFIRTIPLNKQSVLAPPNNRSRILYVPICQKRCRVGANLSGKSS